MTILHGRIKLLGVKRFSNFWVRAVFSHRVAASDPPVFVQNRAETAVRPNGAFRLEIPAREQRRGLVQLVVTAPDGSVAGRMAFDDAAPPDKLEIPVEILPPTVILPGEDITLGARLKFTGVAIDSAGRGLQRDLLVVIWARPDGEEKAAAISIARTAVGGYFSAQWPSTTFAEAFAIISGGKPIPITLEDGRLPLRMILVGSAVATPGNEDCGCDDNRPPRSPDEVDISSNPSAFSQDFSRCVDFSMPNRTVEEVTYQAVVRTTQPALKPADLRPGKPIPQWLLDRLMQLARLNPGDFQVMPQNTPNESPILTSAPSRGRVSAGVVFSGAVGGGAAFTESTGTLAAAVRSTTAELALPEIQDNPVLSLAVAKAERFTGGFVLESEGATLRPFRAEIAKQVIEKRIRAKQPLEFESSVLTELVRSPIELTAERLLVAERTSVLRRFSKTVQALIQPAGDRFALDSQHQINWDQFPDAFQASSIAHGHIITIKQVWRADGYSLGDLLYSLPLAPGQQKLISILDWERSEVASRRASRLETEGLSADLSHDRDVSDIIRTTLNERMDASSHADTSAVGGGIGGFLGPLVFGAAGGVSSAGSTASQTSGRDVSGFALNRVRDRTLQSASAVRNQRATVVQTSRQGETVRAQTEAVANYNHCHAVTIEYFEVLRHLQVSQEVAHVQECLFIPFTITPFNYQKALRWREALRTRLRNRTLNWAFDAVQRVENNWDGSDFPLFRYSDDEVDSINGEMLINVRRLPRPADATDGGFVAANWTPYTAWLWDSPNNIWERYMGVALPAARDQIWNESLAPGIMQRILDSINIQLAPLADKYTVDATMVSSFGLNVSILVSLRVTTVNIGRIRASIDSLTLQFGSGVPTGVQILVESITMSYRTAHMTADFFRDRRVLNDLTATDVVQVATPLDHREKQNPRERDRRYAERLIEHLNEHIEFYHRAVWLAMDPNRRYLLLDGFIAPNAGGRSVASVVENRIMGIVGNSLVMPVAPGQHLDSTYEFAEATPEDLRLLYGANPAPPMRISLPTSGVFAEAVMGHCNSCEKIEDTRFWRWEEAPIPDSPTAIAPLSTLSRRSTPPNLAPDTFPEPVVRLQATPSAPDPTGLAAAVQALGVNNIFRDLTGVALNQQNASAALSASIKAGQDFASKAATLAQQRFLNRELDRSLDQIKAARDSKLITDSQAKELTESALRGAIGEKRPATESPTKTDAVKRAMERVPGAKSGSLRVTRPEGTVEVKTGNGAGTMPIDVKVDPEVVPVLQPTNLVCWAAGGLMMASWRSQTSMTIETMLDGLGGNWRTLFDNNQPLSGGEFQAFAAALGLVEEGPVSYTPEGLARLVASKGPLLEIGDDGIENNSIVHVRVITAVKGDGTPENTFVTLADSATGTIITERFTEFDQRHAADEPVRAGLGVFHY